MDPRDIQKSDEWFRPGFGERLNLNHEHPTYRMLDILAEGVQAEGLLRQMPLTEEERNAILGAPVIAPPAAPAPAAVAPPANP
ncbi:hypothetical protein L195_g055304 [Trifolium pratense]|uniref:Uncharacterized protein n=1 Tax=Trifolium pratense TaxID=57577 RepID=A0A2K3KKM6_TRIPR|nr:hypothetical protein L195_g055304 [Trifolium pratense]